MKKVQGSVPVKKQCPKCGRWEEKVGHHCPKKKPAIPPQTRLTKNSSPEVSSDVSAVPDYDSLYSSFTQEVLLKVGNERGDTLVDSEETLISGNDISTPNVADMLTVGQVPMWLTAREIRENWQALDGDKQDSFINDKVKETENELWERKFEEALWRNDMGDPISDEYEDEDGEWVDNYHIVGGKRVPGDAEWTLLQDIQVNGVLYPVSLQFHRSRVGSSGKPEILGGHHRVALMSEYSPDGFIPVEFFESPEQARKGLGWQY